MAFLKNRSCIPRMKLPEGFFFDNNEGRFFVSSLFCVKLSIGCRYRITIFTMSIGNCFVLDFIYYIVSVFDCIFSMYLRKTWLLNFAFRTVEIINSQKFCQNKFLIWKPFQESKFHFILFVFCKYTICCFPSFVSQNENQKNRPSDNKFYNLEILTDFYLNFNRSFSGEI